MSRQSLPLIIGVAFAVAVVATGGAAGVAAPIIMIAAGAAVAVGTYAGYKLFPAGTTKSTSSLDGAIADAIQIATASEGPPVTVIAGNVRITGNFIQDNEAYHFSVPVAQTTTTGGGGKGDVVGGGGGGGSSSVIVGHLYFASYEYALCMGPIDGVGLVWSSPNEVQVRTSGWTLFGASATLALPLTGTHSEAGTVTIYRGNPDQTRVMGDIYASVGNNYRNVCFVLYNGYCIGDYAVPKTHSWQLLRWPKCVVDLDGSGTFTDVVGMATRGSTDDTNISWYDANPAAFMYEFIQNTVWGMGKPTCDIDIDSFVSASQFYASINLGVSIQITSATSFESFRDTMLQHVGLAGFWNGEQYTCRVIHQTTDDIYQNVPLLDSSSISDFKITRQMPDSTYNEMRAEFVDNLSAYKAGLTIAQSTNAVFSGQSPTPVRLNLRWFSNLTTVQGQLSRLQRESNYPFLVAEFYMFRYFSQLQPYDLIQIVWAEWGASPINGYFRITSIDDDEQSEKGIRVQAIEDFYLSPTTDGAATHPTPTPSWQNTPTTPDSEIDRSPPTDLAFPVLNDIFALELTCYLAGGLNGIVLMADKPASWISSLKTTWSLDGAMDWHSVGEFNSFAITGTLLTAIPLSSFRIDRRNSFEFALRYTANEADILSAGTKVLSGSDSMENIGASNAMWIGQELFQIGKITKLSANHYKAENYMRACGETLQAVHSISDKFFFQASPIGAITAEMVTANVDVVFDNHFSTFSRTDPTGTTVYLPSTFGSTVKQISELGKRPFAPSLISKTGSGPYTFVIRPRLIFNGAGTSSDFTAELYHVNGTMEDLNIIWQNFNGGSAIGALNVASFTWTPEDGITSTSGSASFSATTDGGADRVRIWTTRSGRLSISYLEVIL